MKTITLECPDRLHEQLSKLAAAGWFKSPGDTALAAERRYLSLHSVELQENQVMADAQWALNECR